MAEIIIKKNGIAPFNWALYWVKDSKGYIVDACRSYKEAKIWRRDYQNSSNVTNENAHRSMSRHAGYTVIIDL